MASLTCDGLRVGRPSHRGGDQTDTRCMNWLTKRHRLHMTSPAAETSAVISTFEGQASVRW